MHVVGKIKRQVLNTQAREAPMNFYRTRPQQGS